MQTNGKVSIIMAAYNAEKTIRQAIESVLAQTYSDFELFILRNSVSADITMVFARANRLVYWMTRCVELFCKNVWFVCVQRPDDDFQHLCEKHPLHCNYLAISKADIDQLPCATGYSKFMFEVGINLMKFRPVNTEHQRQLKIKYGIDPNKLLAVHVGHCSKGRGLEDFVYLDNQRFERLIIASGMFEDENALRR